MLQFALEDKVAINDRCVLRAVTPHTRIVARPGVSAGQLVYLDRARRPPPSPGETTRSNAHSHFQTYYVHARNNTTEHKPLNELHTKKIRVYVYEFPCLPTYIHTIAYIHITDTQTNQLKFTQKKVNQLGHPNPVEQMEATSIYLVNEERLFVSGVSARRAGAGLSMGTR